MDKHLGVSPVLGLVPHRMSKGSLQRPTYRLADDLSTLPPDRSNHLGFVHPVITT